MKHLEDLPREKALYLLANLSQMEVSEKIDGTNLVFGFEHDGRFYTTRANKGKQERFYTNNDYDDIPTNNVFKSAHAALSAAVAASPTPGREYEIEILYGRQPNAVVYGSSRIVFIDEFTERMLSPVTVTTDMIFSDDGVDLYKQRVTTDWSFDNIPKVTVNNIRMDEELSQQEMKQHVVNSLVRRIKPTFRDADDLQSHEDFGIEGLVIKNPKDGSMVKIVDKHTFTLINQFNFAIRNELKATGPRFNPTNNTHLYQTFTATVGYQQLSIYDTMLQEFATLIGIPGLGKYMTITRTLKKYESPENFIEQWTLIDIDSTRTAFIHTVDTAIGKIDHARSTFFDQWETYRLILTSGQEIRYTPEIHRRTLTVFAEVRQELLRLKQKITDSASWSDLAHSIYGKQLQIAFPK